MKLYHVTTKVKEFEYDGHLYLDVTFQWFCHKRPDSLPRPYAELIKDYDPNDHHIGYAEEAVDELFTADEAAQLKSYLDSNYDGETTITECKLPLPKNVMGHGAIPVGGG